VDLGTRRLAGAEVCRGVINFAIASKTEEKILGLLFCILPPYIANLLPRISLISANFFFNPQKSA
jgi:hypothetical protein